jgi:hypothetical protein
VLFGVEAAASAGVWFESTAELDGDEMDSSGFSCGNFFRLA